MANKYTYLGQRCKHTYLHDGCKTVWTKKGPKDVWICSGCGKHFWLKPEVPEWCKS